MSPPLLVGCPVWRREWVLPTWFEHVEEACHRAAVEPQYLFVTDPSLDPSVEVIAEEAHMRKRHFQIITVEERDRPDRRQWTEARLRHMVDVRNALLRGVREAEPGFFLSVDSDILLHPQAVASMVEETGRFDAVGGKVYLSKAGTKAPSCGMLDVNGQMKIRHDLEGHAAPVHVIMAIKLMGPTAYAIDYEYHHKGEDIGWSIACRRARLKLGWDAKVCSKHIFRQFDDAGRPALSLVDRRCGF